MSSSVLAPRSTTRVAVTHVAVGRCEDDQVAPRFLTLADVAETLNISASQTYALVRSGDLPAIKVGGRGQWRVEATELEAYIARMYAETADFVRAHPLGRDETVPADES
jgi:excisionase family DNA binding protein